MAYATEAKQHVARKPHICDWCGESIVAGETYKSWRWYDIGCVTVRSHIECYASAMDVAADGWEPEFGRHEPRGCGCGFTQGCPTCAARKQPTQSLVQPVADVAGA